MTNIELITDALLDLGVINESETPTAEQGQHALRKLNQMLEKWEESGIKLGWSQQLPADISDTAPLPPYAESGVTSKLAIALAPSYGGAASVTPALIEEANDGFALIQRKAALANLTPSDTRNMPAAEGRLNTENILTGN
jgi:hypothetical protein